MICVDNLGCFFPDDQMNHVLLLWLYLPYFSILTEKEAARKTVPLHKEVITTTIQQFLWNVKEFCRPLSSIKDLDSFLQDKKILNRQQQWVAQGQPCTFLPSTISHLN